MDRIRTTVQATLLAVAIAMSGLAPAAEPLARSIGEPQPPVSAALRSAAAGGDAQAQYQLAAALACGRGARANRARRRAGSKRPPARATCSRRACSAGWR